MNIEVLGVVSVEMYSVDSRLFCLVPFYERLVAMTFQAVSEVF